MAVKHLGRTVKSLVSRIAKRIHLPRKLENFHEIASFWDNRYKMGGDSGAGSYGDAATFKAEFVNGVARDYKVKSVIDFGCGDGNQLTLLYLDGVEYIGLDIAPEAISLCETKFKNHKSAPKFKLQESYEDFALSGFDLALSLDVLYHLTDDRTYFQYLDALFSASHYVVIYSMNFEDPHWSGHSRPRNFTKDVESRFPGNRLLKVMPSSVPEETGMEFFLYENPSQER